MNRPSATSDDATPFDQYWESAAREPIRLERALVHDALRVFGTGRVLDVGCGAGGLVLELLQRGADAHGVDVSRVCVARAARRAPGRFHQGSVASLPFADAEFDFAVAIDLLQHLEESAIPAALAELRRVVRRGLLVRVPQLQDGKNRWHRTLRPRSFWEGQLFAAGFARHPRSLAVVPYEQLEHEPDAILMPVARLPGEGGQPHPWPGSEERVDAARTVGRRAESRLACYQQVATLVRPNDVVLDHGCGGGDGAAVIAANSEAARVLAVDSGEQAVRYGAAVVGAAWPQIDFRLAADEELAWIPDRSVDLVVATREADDSAAIDRQLLVWDRVLKPSGRVVVCTEIEASEVRALCERLAQRFVVEGTWAQTGGVDQGGLELPRRIFRAELQGAELPAADGWLVAAMKSPIGASTQDYKETSFPLSEQLDRPNVVAFRRDYDNPWLIKSMVSQGQRVLSDSALRSFAEQALEGQDLAKVRPDGGAALCVLAYRLLGDADVASEEVDRFLLHLDAYCAGFSVNPNSVRWQVSLHFVAACLLQSTGRRPQAAARFRRCAAIDAGVYSPILGTRTVDALFQAGLLALADRDLDAARQDWQLALATCQRLLQQDWSAFVGDPAQPLAFGLREATDLMDLTARVARGLLDLNHVASRPGQAWECFSFGLRPSIQTLERSLTELRGWSGMLLDQLADERVSAHALRGLQGEIDSLREELRGERATAEELRQQQRELEQQLEMRSAELADARKAVAELEREVAHLQRLRGVRGAVRALGDRFKK